MMMKCPKCKREIDNDSVFCEYCGTRVQKKSKKWLWVGIALVACILVIVGINSLIEYSYIAQQQAIEKQRVADSLALVAQQQAEEAARQVELERQREAERQRQAELERQREAERQRQAELERQREVEQQRQAELERQQREARRQELIRQGYVDLGLPSGTWWGKRNEGGNDSRYTYKNAKKIFGSQLPSYSQFRELSTYCSFTMLSDGVRVTGPNGNSIFFPAAGYRSCGGWLWEKDKCIYWTSDKYLAHIKSYIGRSSNPESCTSASIRLVKKF